MKEDISRLGIRIGKGMCTIVYRLNMKQSLNKILPWLWRLLIVLSLLRIFRGVVFFFIDKVILPITSAVESDSICILISIVVFVISAYLVSGRLKCRNYYVENTRPLVLAVYSLIIFYVFFRFSGHYVFYGVGKFTYIDTAVVLAGMLEIVTYFLTLKREAEAKVNEKEFVLDNPSKTDKLGRTDYAELLLNKIYATYKSGRLSDASMTILLNEKFGAGKTTFFYLLAEKSKGRFKTCLFKPWQFNSGDGMIEELLRLLEEQYSYRTQLVRQLKEYSKLLSEGGYNNVLKFISSLLSNEDSLPKRYEAIKHILHEIDDPLVVFVDDVDRLQAEELFSLLKLLRDGAAFPNIFYLVAADKEVLEQMLETKGIKNSDEYLKKFFNFELLFPKDDSFINTLLSSQIASTLQAYYSDVQTISLKDEVLSPRNLQTVFKTPRDVYRYINLLSYSLDLFKSYDIIEEVYVPDLLRLLLIQFISPTVYKIFRDEMNLLLDVRAEGGRISLKNEYEGIIRSRLSKKDLQDVVEIIKNSKKLQNASKEPENQESEEGKSLFGVIAQERPSKEDILSDLLNDLFPDVQGCSEKNRICYIGEYFKFFAGKYSKDEVSYQYMKNLIGSSNEAFFEKTMGSAILQGKSDFLFHKLEQYIEDAEIEKDIPKILQRCIKIQDSLYRYWEGTQTYFKSPKNFCQVNRFKSIYMKLLLVNDEDMVTDIEEIERFKSIYATNKQYCWLASSLSFPIINECTFVYGNELLSNMKERLIQRFIKEELADNPFVKEKLEVIPLLRSMYPAYWDEHFKRYVKKSSDPNAWLYELFEPAGNLLKRNHIAYNNLVDNRTLDSYAKDVLGLDLPEEIIHDLVEISGFQEDAAFNVNRFSRHPFLIAAKKWWDAKEQFG